jgi:hypothetical protein
VTPWQTHLGSEEYEPDARVIADYARNEPTGQQLLAEDIGLHVIPYLRLSANLTNLEVFQIARPYLYGYIWEVCDVSAVQMPGAHFSHRFRMHVEL